MSWRTIDSAPRDGTCILLFEIAESGEPYIFTGRFDADRDERPYITSWVCAEYSAFSHSPTHWMPLPDPPKE